jgi:long-chain fatty acid transport protein
MRSLALAAILILAPAVALAGGYAVPNVSPRDLGMAGSAHAAQVDAGAVFVNPAALSRLDGLSLSIAGALIDNRAQWTNPLPPHDTASQYLKPKTPPACYASYSMPLPWPDMRVGFGAGVTIPFGGNVYWPAGWPGRFDILTVDRRIYGTYFTGGVQLAKWIRVGGGLIWYRGTEKLTQNVNFLTTETEAELGVSGDKLSYDLSMELQPIEPLKLAFDYKHKADMTLTGSATYGGAPAQFTSRTLDQGVQHQLTMPNYLAFGASYQVLPQVLVTGSFTWDRFIVYDRDAFIGTAGTSLIVQRNYHNGYTFRLGTEFTPIAKLKVRLGILRDIAPTPPEWLSATIPDSDVWGTSIGVGYTVLPGLDVNAAYFHAFYDQVTTPPAANGQYNVFPGTYRPYANIPSIGVSWTPEVTFKQL